jgi:hypothetical protein
MKNILHQMASRSNDSECQVILMWVIEGDGRWPDFVKDMQINWSFI